MDNVTSVKKERLVQLLDSQLYMSNKHGNVKDLLEWHLVGQGDGCRGRDVTLPKTIICVNSRVAHFSLLSLSSLLLQHSLLSFLPDKQHICFSQSFF